VEDERQQVLFVEVTPLGGEFIITLALLLVSTILAVTC
jgi:hypothetical protein